MESLYPVLRVLHVLAFVFMSVPLFNLIVVNERAQLGSSFSYDADRYMENIIRRGATRCFAFQATVLVTGVLLLLVGPLGITALWSSWVLMAKTLLLFVLMGLLSFVHLRLQPSIDGILAEAQPGAPVPDDLPARVKPLRALRKRLATVCLFLVIVTIILGLQVYVRFSVGLTSALIAIAALFTWRVNKSLVRFGWV
ncbi:MAG: hypothetical protein ABFS34_09400 [Gemmatimonadota bacterium]